MFIIVFLCFAFFSMASDRTIFHSVQDLNIERFYHKGPKTWLLSYPRSGNSWIRYCIEFLTKRPTLQKPGGQIIEQLNCPMGYFYSLSTDYDKLPVWKAHRLAGGIGSWVFPQKDTLIILVRNYKEVFVRQLGDRFSVYDMEKPEVISYFENLETYHSWRSDRKLLLYYEDIISNPRQVLETLVRFLDEKPIFLDQFMHDYDRHKKNSIAHYSFGRESQTGGQSVIHHSLKLTQKERDSLDLYVQNEYPILWEKYLLRYVS